MTKGLTLVARIMLVSNATIRRGLLRVSRVDAIFQATDW